MSELTVFRRCEFGEIRTVEIDGIVWFVAVDVCRALDIMNPTDSIKRLDEDERARFNLGHPYGETNIINEPGLYSLVLGSRKPEAKAFKRWITHEVIPAIRRTGRYEAGPARGGWGMVDGYQPMGPTYAVRVDEECYEFVCRMSMQCGVPRARVVSRIIREAMPRMRLRPVAWEMVLEPMDGD